MSQWSTLQQRVGGKWQIPLFAVSLALLAGAFLRIKPDQADYTPQQACTFLDQLIESGVTDDAIEWGEQLLLPEERTEAEKAPVHLRLARAKSLEAERDRTGTAKAGAAIVDHYEHATAMGLALQPHDLLNLGRALEWQGRLRDAVPYFEEAIDRGIEGRSDLLRHTILMNGRLGESLEQTDARLDSFLEEIEDHRLDLRLWALEQKMDVLHSLGQDDAMSTLLVRDAERFRASDFADEFSFLEALLLYRQGLFDEAETYLRTIRNRIEIDDPVYARTGWLLGRVVMSDGEPQRPLEALSFFRDVLDHHPDGPYAVASYVGRAESLAMLERHEEAADAYRVAIEELGSLRDHRLIDRDVLRMSLSVMSQVQREAGQLRAAVEYARLAVSLVDTSDSERAAVLLEHLGELEQSLGEELHGQAVRLAESSDASAAGRFDEARELFGDAAQSFIELGQIQTLHEDRSAMASWRAAELLARADQPERSAQLYRTFTIERPDHPLVARALLRIGQLRQAMGQLPEAIDTYRECYRRFPRTIDGSRALIPLAFCYMGMGPDNDELAEKTLRIILDDSDVFTPQAPEFTDALFMLGEVLNRRSEYEQGIATLEEALDRYPDDPRGLRARSLLADCYRQSGLALKRDIADAASAAEIERMRIESAARFSVAQRLYRELINEYEIRAAQGLNRLETMYLRHAYLYEADCAYEVGDHRTALKLYEEAAGNYKDTPTGLAAYVQIINCHIFLGEVDEARAALARALILVDAIPAEVFDKSVSPETRDDWRRYFQWLGDSEIF